MIINHFTIYIVLKSAYFFVFCVVENYYDKFRPQKE